MSSMPLKNFLTNKRVAVIGAAGSIGSALAKTIAKQKPKQLLILDQDETGIFELYEELKDKCKVDYIIASIRDQQKLFDVFGEYKPQIVYHAAAYKHVALMERFPQEAIKTNVEGTKNVIAAAKFAKAEKMVFISSDKAVNPKCVMGKTKLEGEKMCLEEQGMTKFIVVRFGNVMASRGSLLPIWNKQIAENKNLTVTHPKMERYMMGIYDAVDLVLEASRTGNGGEKFILDMGQPVKIAEFAKTIIRISGKPLGITYTNPKQGEKFSEELMTKEEGRLAVKKGNLWIIYPKDTSSGKTEN